MLTTAARLLRLLTLLQTRAFWAGADLATRLEITDRTLRRDVERLRSLGYPVQATVGTGGGYHLGAGSALPPLVLDDDEAVAVVLGLRTAGGGAVAEVEEAAARAQAKLELLLPPRLRKRVAALNAAIVPAARNRNPASARALTLLAGACNDHHRVSFAYESHEGSASRRQVEPQALVHTGRRFYLVAWDLGRQAWRTFRVDRVTTVNVQEARFAPRPPPDADLAAYVAKAASTGAYKQRARLLFHAPIDVVAQVVTQEVGHIESAAGGRCVVTLGGRSWDEVASWLGVFQLDFDVLDPPELAEAVRKVAHRLTRAADMNGATQSTSRVRRGPAKRK